MNLVDYAGDKFIFYSLSGYSFKLMRTLPEICVNFQLKSIILPLY
jgi:hypothetical protein